MGAALGWGALAASSLVIGAFLGLVLAFGAGALVSAVSFELVEEGANVGGPGWVALGLAAGALVYYFVNDALGRNEATAGPGTGLALGAFLDGIPEQAVLGISLAEGNGVSVGLLVAIFVSNLPEAVGSASEMSKAGIATHKIRRLWIGVALVCVLAAGGGYAIADVSGGHLQAAINGFAAGALLVLLVDEMIPAATSKFGQRAGLVTTLGFAVAAGLSSMSA
jgi:ZIP family zinc transporter